MRAFDRIITEARPRWIVCDLTCLTKLHTIALATELRRHSETVGCVIVHSIPENYVLKDSNSEAIGWRDVIVAPLAANASLFNETRGRGIILLVMKRTASS